MSDLPQPFLIAESPALDFLNSTCAPHGEIIEWLRSGADMLAWMNNAGLLSAAQAAHLSKNFPAAALDQAAQDAIALREEMRGHIDSCAGEGLGEDSKAHLEPVRKILANTSAKLVISDDTNDEAGALRISAGSTLSLVAHLEVNTPADLLAPIAVAFANLFATADFAQVKQCEGPECNLMFVDTTKNKKRRWCSMSVCGNRAKAAAFRARKRSED